jgi:hypothetical protein
MIKFIKASKQQDFGHESRSANFREKSKEKIRANSRFAIRGKKITVNLTQGQQP